MPKRKFAETVSSLWDYNLPVPKWPKKHGDWSKDDMDSALLINALQLEPPKNPPKNFFVKFDTKKPKVSMLLQALDLANFDDYEIEREMLYPGETDRVVVTVVRVHLARRQQ